MTCKLNLFKGVGQFNFPKSRFHEELISGLIVCSETRDVNKYIFCNEDISMETNWPFYGGKNKNLLVFGTWDLKANQNYSRYMNQLLESAFDNKDKYFVVVNMHPFIRLHNYFSGVRNIIVADVCLTWSDRFLNNNTISFPAMPVVKNNDENIVGKREILASFQGANTHKSSTELSKIASSEIVINIVKQSGYFNNIETFNSSVVSYSKLLNKSTEVARLI